MQQSGKHPIHDHALLEDQRRTFRQAVHQFRDMGGETVLIGTLQQLVEHIVQADIFAVEHIVQGISHIAAVFLEPFGGFFLGGGFGQVLDLSKAVRKLCAARTFAALIQLIDRIKQGAPILAACDDDVVVDLV